MLLLVFYYSDSFWRASSPQEPADTWAQSRPQIPAPPLAPFLFPLNSCLPAPKKMVFYNFFFFFYNCLLFLCLQLPFQTAGMADVRVLHLGSPRLYLVLMPSRSSRNAGWGASSEGGGVGRREAGAAFGIRGDAAHHLSPPGTNWLAGEHHGHLWPCAGRTCPLAPCPSVQAAGRAVRGTASYALSYF